jgi:hypothetical protein
MSLIDFFSGIQVGESLGEKKLIMHYHLPFDIPQTRIKYVVMSNAEMLIEEGKKLQCENFMGTLITTNSPRSYHWMPYSNFLMEGLKDVDFSKGIEEIADELFGKE